MMLWIWPLSHLGDSKARLFSLGSKARLVMSHFIREISLVLGSISCKGQQ